MSAQEYYNPQGSSVSSAPSAPPPPYQPYPLGQQQQGPRPSPPQQQYGFDPKQSHQQQQQQAYPQQQQYAPPQKQQFQQPQQPYPQQYPPPQQQQHYPPQPYPPPQSQQRPGGPGPAGMLNPQRPPQAGYSYSHDGRQNPYAQNGYVQQPQHSPPPPRPAVRFDDRPASAQPYLEAPSRHGRNHSRSRSRSRDRRDHRHHHQHRRDSDHGKEKSGGGLSTLVGAGGGAIIGDAIFPGLGTVGGALLGGLGGRKVAKDQRSRSHSDRGMDRYDREWEHSQRHRHDRYD